MEEDNIKVGIIGATYLGKVCFTNPNIIELIKLNETNSTRIIKPITLGNREEFVSPAGKGMIFTIENLTKSEYPPIMLSILTNKRFKKYKFNKSK